MEVPTRRYPDVQPPNTPSKVVSHKPHDVFPEVGKSVNMTDTDFFVAGIRKNLMFKEIFLLFKTS